jgi:hypothetical protein
VISDNSSDYFDIGSDYYNVGNEFFDISSDQSDNSSDFSLYAKSFCQVLMSGVVFLGRTYAQIWIITMIHPVT